MEIGGQKETLLERLLMVSSGFVVCLVLAFLLAQFLGAPWLPPLFPGLTPVQTILVLVCFGLSSVLLCYVVGKKRPATMGIVFTLTLSGLTLMLSQAVVEAERAQAQRMVSAVSGSIQSQIIERVTSDSLSLIRMARRWEAAGKPSRKFWESDAALYAKHYPELQVMQWADSSYFVRWLVPLKGNEAAVNLNIRKKGRALAALETARKRRQATLSRPINLIQGGTGYVVCVPLFPNGRFDGFIVGVYRIDKLLQSLPEGVTEGYSLTVVEDVMGRIPIIQQGETTPELDTEYGRTVPITLESETWFLRVSPSPQTAAQFRSPVPVLILCTGLLISGLFGTVLYSWQRLHAAQEGLEKEIEERRAIEESLRHSEARLNEAQRLARLGFWEYEPPTDSFYCSDEVYRLMQFDPADGPLTYERLIARIHPEESEAHLAQIAEALEQCLPFEADIRGQLDDGSIIWIHSQGRPVRDEQGRVIRLLGTVRDITDRKRYEDELQAVNEYLASRQSALLRENETLEMMATTDALTGLFNRHALQDKVQTEIESCHESGKPLSLLMVDVDHFKQFNDTFGHLAGDQVLRTVGDVLLAATRLQDFVARFGGEEFVVLLIDTDADLAQSTAERLRDAIAQRAWDNRRVTVSVGIATLHDGIASAKQLIADADHALYAAKAAGRDRVVHYSTATEHPPLQT